MLAVKHPKRPPLVGAASFTIYSRTKEFCRDRHWLARNHILDVSTVGGLRFELPLSAPHSLALTPAVL